MTEPKRRGRPLGAKNKPKEFPVPPPEITPPIQAAEVEPVRLDPQPQRFRVVVRWKVAMGQPGEETDIPWPESWPLPQRGDMVRAGNGVPLGFLSHIDFDLPGNRIVLQLQ